MTRLIREMQIKATMRYCPTPVRMCVLVPQSCLTLCNPWTVAHQSPLSKEFSRQEYWSGLPFSSPGDLLNPGNKPVTLALQADSLQTEPLGKPSSQNSHHQKVYKQ